MQISHIQKLLTSHIKKIGHMMSVHANFRNSYNANQIRLIRYLKEHLSSGKCFTKSKYIARELGLTSREVGTNMRILSEICPDFSIVKYSYSNSTTWRVTASYQ